MAGVFFPPRHFAGRYWAPGYFGPSGGGGGAIPADMVAGLSGSGTLAGLLLDPRALAAAIGGGGRITANLTFLRHLAATEGNTIPPVPRMTGRTDVDMRALTHWFHALYEQLVLVHNISGRLPDHGARLGALEALKKD